MTSQLITDLYNTLEPYMTKGKIYEFRITLIPPGEGFVIHNGKHIIASPLRPIGVKASIVEMAPTREGPMEPVGDLIGVNL